MSLTFLQVGQPLEWTNLPPPPPPPAGTTCALARCVGIDTAAVKARLPATSAGYYETGTLGVPQSAPLMRVSTSHERR